MDAGFQQGGIQMSGSNTDGGGGSFYLGGDEEGQQQQEQGNPELVLANPGEVDRRSENRQYLESLIIERTLAWLSPWKIDPSENLKVRGRKDIIVKNAEDKTPNKKRFLVNA